MQDIGERCRKFICKNDFPGDIKLDETALFAPVKFNDFPIGFIDSISDDIVYGLIIWVLKKVLMEIFWLLICM